MYHLPQKCRSLLTQLKKFQALVSGSGNSRHTTKVGACLMVCVYCHYLQLFIAFPCVQVVVLCFAVLLGGWVPNHSYWTSVSTDYATTSGEGTVRVQTLSYMDTICMLLCVH